MIKPNVTVSSGQEVAARIRALQNTLSAKKEVAVGLPSTSGQHPTAKMTYAQLGAIHEFGSGDIPERSFLRVPLRAKQEELAKIFAKLIKMVIEGELTMSQALDQIGAKGAAISQEAISDGISPPNKADTVRRKGSSTPLIDHGHLRQAITWVVQDKEA